MDGIFISYRREDSAGYAGRLYDRLAAHFGPEHVFMDVEGIDPGTDFVDAIERAVTSCQVLIVLIGREWLEIADSSGQRRIDDPHDFIRLETGTALQRDILVVPVLLEGAAMPQADALPEELKALSRRQAIEISHKQWEASTANLIVALDKICHPESVGAIPVVPGGQPESGGPSNRLFGDRNRGIWITLALVCVMAVGGWWLTRSLQPETAQTTAPLPTTLEPVARAGSEAVSGSDPLPVLEPTPAAASAPAPVSATEPAPAPANPPVPLPKPVAGRLQVTPLQIDFGNLEVGNTRRGRIILANDGEGELAVPPLVLDPASGINLDHNCPARLLPAARCQIELQFEPREAGILDRRLRIDRPGAPPVTVSLSATVTEKSVKPPPEPKTADTPVSEKASIPAPKAVPLPRIRRFSGKVTGATAELCYTVENARQLSISPQPGGLTNLQRDCIEVALDGPTTFRIVARGPDRSVSDTLTLTPDRPAVSTPAPAEEPVIDSRLPRVRDQWIYRVTGRWASSPQRTIAVSVLSVTPDQVEEGLARLVNDAPRFIGKRVVRGPVPYVLRSPDLGSEFSPYLAAFGDLRQSSSWRGIPTPDINSFWTGWHTTGEVAGREPVTLPAGAFNAWKVELWSARTASGSPAERDSEPVKVHYRIWYAEPVKRYVKMVRTTIAASGQAMDTDTFVLVDYRQQ